MNAVTQILRRLEHGESAAGSELLRLVYDELRKLAAARLAYEQSGQTLQATALVYEAWLRLVGGDREQGDDQRWDGLNTRVGPEPFAASRSETCCRYLTDLQTRRLSQYRSL